MQKTPVNKDVFAILYQIWPLNRFELRLLSQLWQKLPLFLEYGHFQIQKRPHFLAFSWKTAFSDPLNTKRALCVVLKKDTLFHIFFCSGMCAPIYLNAPRGINIISSSDTIGCFLFPHSVASSRNLPHLLIKNSVRQFNVINHRRFLRTFPILR